MISFESGSKSIQRRTATRFKSQFPPTHPTPSVHMQSILQVGISRPNTWDSLRAFIREKKKRKKEILKIVRYRSSTLLQKTMGFPNPVQHAKFICTTADIQRNYCACLAASIPRTFSTSAVLLEVAAVPLTPIDSKKREQSLEACLFYDLLQIWLVKGFPRVF